MNDKCRIEPINPHGKSIIQGMAALYLALVMACLSSVSSFAQQASPSTITDDQVNAVAKQLYCPVCENTPLDVCPTQACAQWRDLIRLKLSEGWTSQQIKTYFVQQYGDRVLAAPPARGLNLLVYIIPPVTILAGAFILFRALRAWKQPAEFAASCNMLIPQDFAQPSSTEQAASAANAVPSQDRYLARLEEELRKSDQ